MRCFAAAICGARSSRFFSSDRLFLLRSSSSPWALAGELVFRLKSDGKERSPSPARPRRKGAVAVSCATGQFLLFLFYMRELGAEEARLFDQTFVRFARFGKLLGAVARHHA